MIFGILPFLIQWIALSQMGKLSNYHFSHSYNTIVPSSPIESYSYEYPSSAPSASSSSSSASLGGGGSGGGGVHHSLPPKSHWTLLSDFQQLDEDEIEIFLPQLCNMILDRSSLSDPRILEYFEQILCQKCSECLPFGIRVTNMLRALFSSEKGNQYGLFRQMLLSTTTQSSSSSSASDQVTREAKMRQLLDQVEQVTAKGNHNLPLMVSELRSEYYRDFQFLLDTLGRLGIELKSYPIHQRNHHLRRALSQCNALFYHRMLTQKSITELSNEEILSFYHEYSNLQVDSIAQYCPAAACFSLHFPLQHSSEKCLRILRFIESESELLPSKERCPYLVVVELLEQPFPCNSDELYTEGRKLCFQTTQDRLQHRGMNYQNPQVVPTLSHYDHHYYQNQQDKDPHTSSSQRNYERLPPALPSSYSSYRSRRRSQSHRVGDRHKQALKNEPEYTAADDGVQEERENCLICKEQQMEELRASMDLMDEVSTEKQIKEEKNYEFITHPQNFMSIKRRLLARKLENDRTDTTEEESEELISADGEFDVDDLLSSDEQIEYINKLSKAENILKHRPPNHRNHQNIQLFGRAAANEIPASEKVFSTTNSHSNVEISEEDPLPDVQPLPMKVDGVYDMRGGAGRNVNWDYPVDPSSTDASYKASNYYGGSAAAPDGHYQYSSNQPYPFDDPQSSSYPSSITPPYYPPQPPHDNYHPSQQHYHHTTDPTDPYYMYPNTAPSPQFSPHSYPNLHHLPTPAQSQHPHHPSLPAHHSRAFVRTKTWEEKKAIIKSLSPFGHLEGWNLASFIVKSGDDLRKEVLAMQLIEYFQKIFQYEHVDIFLKPYQILVTGSKCGLIEFLEGTISVDRIKKLYLRSGVSSGSGTNPVDPNIPPTTTSASSSSNSNNNSNKIMSLKEYFELHFGESYSPLYHKAIYNFIKSLVGYSLVTYILQVKDRHNANILIDSEGHIIHIDFGFILGESPGFNINFETAPFKFPKEYLELICGGEAQGEMIYENPMFQLFEDLFVKGFLAIQKHLDGLTSIIQLFYEDKKGNDVITLLKNRLLAPRTSFEIKKLIHESMDNFRTRSYDWYQQTTNNIYM